MTPEQLPREKHTTEYLANERTFLAWVRTSIAVLSLGFVIAKFSVWMHELGSRIAPGTPLPSSGMAMPIGMTMMAFGGLIMVLAAWHYYRVNKAIEQGQVRATYGLVLSVAIAIVVLSILMIISMLIAETQL